MPSYKVKENDRIIVNDTNEKDINVVAENIALDIQERIIPGYYSETVGTDGMDKIFIEESISTK